MLFVSLTTMITKFANLIGSLLRCWALPGLSLRWLFGYRPADVHVCWNIMRCRTLMAGNAQGCEYLAVGDDRWFVSE